MTKNAEELCRILDLANKIYVSACTMESYENEAWGSTTIGECLLTPDFEECIEKAEGLISKGDAWYLEQRKLNSQSSVEGDKDDE